jgi:hypothetical protein
MVRLPVCSWGQGGLGGKARGASLSQVDGYYSPEFAPWIVVLGHRRTHQSGACKTTKLCQGGAHAPKKD